MRRRAAYITILVEFSIAIAAFGYGLYVSPSAMPTESLILLFTIVEASALVAMFLIGEDFFSRFFVRPNLKLKPLRYPDILFLDIQNVGSPTKDLTAQILGNGFIANWEYLGWRYMQHSGESSLRSSWSCPRLVKNEHAVIILAHRKSGTGTWIIPVKMTEGEMNFELNSGEFRPFTLSIAYFIGENEVQTKEWTFKLLVNPSGIVEFVEPKEIEETLLLDTTPRPAPRLTA